MSVCAVPAAATKQIPPTGSYTASPPDPVLEICGGGSTVIITPPGPDPGTVVCCPVPGPVGPQGCGIKWAGAWTSGKNYNFESGNPCSTDMVKHNGEVYIVKTQHTSSSDNEPGVGASWEANWDEFSASGMKWKGDWAAGEDYSIDDTVRLYSSSTQAGYGNAYVCVADHHSAPGNTPPNAAYWAPATEVGAGGDTKSEGWFDSVFDWLNDAVANGDWLSLLAAGVGLVAAGALVTKMFTQDGKGDGQASSVYTGSPGFSGSAYAAPTLKATVTSIMKYAGKAPGDIDVSLLPDVACEFTIAASATLATLMEQLSLTYQFDIVPSGGLVKFVPKNIASVRTLTTDDLGHISMGDDEVAGTSAYTAKRLQGIDLPRSVTFNYISSGLNYNVFSQVATLETYTEGQDVKLDVPFTLTDADAKRIAETSLVNAHIERQQLTFVTDVWNIDLEPADVITVPLDTGGTMDVRIIEMTSQEDGLLEITGVRADQNTSTYTASTNPNTPPPPQQTTPAVIGYSGAVFVEAPPLNDTDVSARYFAAIHGYAEPGWPGATLYRSVDGGATYNVITSNTAIVTMGMMQAIAPAPANGHQVWDTTTTLTVQLRQGTLTSASSDLAVQNGENWCKVGDEVIGFRNATLISPNTYQLTRLLRGRAGTEPKCGDHVTEELFVLLDQSLTRLEVNKDDLGKTVKYKVVTFGSDISKAEEFDVRPYGLNMRPWKVAHLTAVRDGITNNWTLDWIERPRYNNQLRDYTEITHDPDWAGYAVAIMNSSSVVVRTATSAEPTFVYTSAMQVEDFGSVQTVLKASVVQMTSVVGGGYPYLISA